MAITSLDKAIARWSFQRLPSDELPAVAIEALQLGLETPAMIDLAVAPSTPDPRLHILFEKAINELGRTRMSRTDAGRHIAADIAEQIVQGVISPIEGARAVWEISRDCEELQRRLGSFGGLVSEYDGMREGREATTEKILCEAKELLASG